MADQPTAAPEAEGANGHSQGIGFSIERIYVKDLSLESPGAPQSFQLTEAPAIEVGLRTRGEQVAPDVYECVITLTVTATADGKTVFLVEASQAGLFQIRGVPAADMQPVLAIHCPNVLFSVRPRDDFRRDHPCRLPARAPGPDQLRGALPAATGADADAGPRRHQLTHAHAAPPPPANVVVGGGRVGNRLHGGGRLGGRGGLPGDRASPPPSCMTHRRPSRSRSLSMAATCRWKCWSSSRAGPRSVT